MVPVRTRQGGIFTGKVEKISQEILEENHVFCGVFKSRPKSIILFLPKKEFLGTSVIFLLKEDTFVHQMKVLLTFPVTSKISFKKKIYF